MIAPLAKTRANLLPALGFLFAAVFLFGTRTDPYRINWGDPWSDANAITSGGYFAREGFVKLAFTPIIDIGPVRPDSLQYTHYPPLPDLVNGVQQELFGALTIQQLRLLPDVLSLLSLIFFFRFVRRLFGAEIAAFALPLLATNMLWLQYADTLHHVPLYTSTGYLALDQIGQWLVERRRRSWIIAVVATAVCAFASYDYVLFVPIMALASVYLLGKRPTQREAWPILLATVLGLAASFTFKLLLVTWAVGPTEMVLDLVFQFFERATHAHAADFRDGVWTIARIRLWRFLTPLVWVVTGLLLHGLWRRWRGGTPLVSPAPLVLLAAGLPFILIFRQLFVEQYHPTLQLIPYYAVGSAAVIVALRAHQRRALRVAGVAMFVFLLAWQAREVVRLPKAMIPNQEFDAVARHLDAVGDKRQILMSSLFVDAPSRTFWQHHNIGVPIHASHVRPFLATMFEWFGPDPIRFVELRQTAITTTAAAMDKLVYMYLVEQKRWKWIANPVHNRRYWSRKIEPMVEDSLQVVREGAVPELTTRYFRVYRVEVGASDVAYASPLSEVTPIIDLGDWTSTRFKLHGWSPVEADAAGDRFSRIVPRPLRRYRFTMRGLFPVLTGRSYLRAAVQARLPVAPPDAPATTKVVVRVRSRVAITVALDLNGAPLGSWPVGPAWTEISAPLPEAAMRREVVDEEDPPVRDDGMALNTGRETDSPDEPVQTVGLHVVGVDDHDPVVEVAFVRFDAR